MAALRRCRFEVFGRVQGVSFRAATQQEARQQGVLGFCANTTRRTVIGELQGAPVRARTRRVRLLRHRLPTSL